MKMREEDLIPLGDMLAELTGMPPGQVAGFVVMVGVFEDDGKPGGRLISSTTNLRTVSHMLELASAQVQGELDDLSGLS
jgi:hypothetical protein